MIVSEHGFGREGDGFVIVWWEGASVIEIGQNDMGFCSVVVSKAAGIPLLVNLPCLLPVGRGFGYTFEQVVPNGLCESPFYGDQTPYVKLVVSQTL